MAHLLFGLPIVFSDTISQILIFMLQFRFLLCKTSTGICSASDSILVISKNINISLFGNDICYGDTAFIGVTNLNPSFQSQVILGIILLKY